MALFDDVLECDEFINHWCVKCGTHGALFATPLMFGACPKCLHERIRALRVSGAALPDWLVYLEGATARSLRDAERREAAELSVSLDDLYRCARCDKVIHQKDARYHIDPRTHSSPPYCLTCYGVLKAEEA